MLIFIVILCMSLLLTVSMTGCNDDLIYSSNSNSIKTGTEINMYIVADLHHFSKSMYDDGEGFKYFFSTSDGKLIQYTTEILESITEDIKKEKPDFLILPGDLTTNGDKQSHIELAKFFGEIEKLGTSVFVVPGNHDIKNPWAREFIKTETIKTQNISYEEWTDIYHSFGYDEAISKDKKSVSYLVAPSEDVWLLMLDSTISNKKSKNLYPVRGGELSNKTLEWISKCSNLAKKNNAQLILVMHHNLLDHSEIFNSNYTINNKDQALDVFLEAEIKLALTGHIHIQDIKSFTKNNQKIYDIGTSSALVYPNQYGRLKFTPGKGYNYSTKKINLNIETSEFDKETFKNYIVCLFMEQCCKQYKDCLSDLNELNDEDLDKAYSAIVEMNKMYFSGYRNENLKEITETEGYKILENVSSCFAKEYVNSMLHDEYSDNNTLFVPLD